MRRGDELQKKYTTNTDEINSIPGSIHGAWQILFVGQHQNRYRVLLCQFTNLQQLQLRLLQPIRVARVHHEDDAVGAAGVGPPQRPRLVLPADVPQQEVVGFTSALSANANLKEKKFIRLFIMRGLSKGLEMGENIHYFRGSLVGN